MYKTENMFKKDIISEKLSIKDVKNMVAYPYKNLDKQSTPYFYPYDYKDTKGKAIKDNAICLNYIVLDVDDKTSKGEIAYPAKVLSKLKEFEFYFYTTASSEENSNPIKYRVIIPLKTSIDTDEIYINDNGNEINWKAFKNWVLTLFPFQDENAIRPGGFVCPLDKDNGNYKFILNKGKLFDFYEKKYQTLFKELIKQEKNKINELKYQKDISDFVLTNGTSNKFDPNAPSQWKNVQKAQSIKDYLNTFSNRKRGNSVGEYNLWRALCALKTMNADDESWKMIENHALLNNNWSEVEYNKKVRQVMENSNL